MKKDRLFQGGKQKKIGRDLSGVVAVMLAVLVISVVTLSVSLFSALVTKMLEERCVSATNMLAYELSQGNGTDDVNRMLDELKSRMGCEFTIFEGDTRAYTTVVQDGNRVVGTKLSTAISSIVLKQGESYVGEADILNEKYLCSYVPTTDDSGKVNGLIFAGISKASANQQTLLVIVLSASVSAAAIVVCIALLVLYVKKRVSVPLSEITHIAQRLEQGELGLSSNENIRVKVYANDEIGELGRIFEKTILRMRSYIGEISDILGSIANGDLTNQVQQEYVGDFISIKRSLEGIEATLNTTISQIADSAVRVSSNAGRASSNAHAIAQGSIEQASAVQELASTIGEISVDAERTSLAAEEVGRSVEQASSQLGVSVDYVKHLNTAMEHISQSSEQISKIISTIENIAFQTNILALNAAVEAARAGTAGKGFAVVADEVRNLAAKSDEAAKATKELIEGSITAVNDGSGAVSKVTESLEKTNEIANGMTTKMAVVVEAVEKQTIAINQVTEGIDRISSVVQTNSATSEENAADSEELTTQAGLLKHLVSTFHLKK